MMKGGHVKADVKEGKILVTASKRTTRPKPVESAVTQA
jgi:hypothetical protein